jgi:hypothetical protein
MPSFSSSSESGGNSDGANSETSRNAEMSVVSDSEVTVTGSSSSEAEAPQSEGFEKDAFSPDAGRAKTGTRSSTDRTKYGLTWGYLQDALHSKVEAVMGRIGFLGAKYPLAIFIAGLVFALASASGYVLMERLSSSWDIYTPYEGPGSDGVSFVCLWVLPLSL